LLALVLVCTGSARAGVLYSNPLPTLNINTGSGATQSDIAPVYGSMADPNVSGSPSEPYMLGDTFTLPAGTNTITGFTIYEVGLTPGASLPLSLYIGPDQQDLTLDSSTYNSSLLGTYESINTGNLDYSIYEIDFTGLNLTLSGGTANLYDFAIGAPSTFALLMGAANGYSPSSLLGGTGFYYYLPDGSASGPPIATYSYCNSACAGYELISGYSNQSQVDAIFTVNGTTTPEPSTFGLLALGLGGLLMGVRRRVR
jgi:hypothetical protein